MKRRTLLLAGIAASLAATARGQDVVYSERADVLQWIDLAVARYGFSRDELLRTMARAQYSATVERLMQPAASYGKSNWFDYRARHIDQQRLKLGVDFWRAHRAALARAQNAFGVPPEIVVAIIGIETFYGRMTGKFRTLDVLMTLSFDYLRRADFYREELAQLLLLAREQGVDPLSLRGSFAGAIGLPQFMPSSIRRDAVDFDHDGHIDLAASAVDAIGSVANYLARRGWRRDLPILFNAQSDQDALDLLGRGIEAIVPWEVAAAVDVKIEGSLPPTTRVLVIDLPVVDERGGSSYLYRVGTANFSALLNYNRSYFYATAVFEFAQALRASFNVPSLERAGTPRAKRPSQKSSHP